MMTVLTTRVRSVYWFAGVLSFSSAVVYLSQIDISRGKGLAKIAVALKRAVAHDLKCIETTAEFTTKKWRQTENPKMLTREMVLLL